MLNNPTMIPRFGETRNEANIELYYDIENIKDAVESLIKRFEGWSQTSDRTDSMPRDIADELDKVLESINVMNKNEKLSTSARQFIEQQTLDLLEAFNRNNKKRI